MLFQLVDVLGAVLADFGYHHVGRIFYGRLHLLVYQLRQRRRRVYTIHFRRRLLRLHRQLDAVLGLDVVV
jgi:hypothetical protein